MRTLQRNKRTIYYALYNGETEAQDSSGNYTGEITISYDAPVAIKANVSPATGQSNQEMFGNLTDYDRVIITDDVSLLIDENSILWVDTTPPEDETVDHATGYDYIVRRVAKSFNGLAIAARKVEMDVPNPEPDVPNPEPEEPEEEPEDEEPGDGE